jgi:hypothetical protein
LLTKIPLRKKRYEIYKENKEKKEVEDWSSQRYEDLRFNPDLRFWLNLGGY